MFGKLSHINPSAHHIDLVNMVILISLLESGHINVDQLSENAFIPCHDVQGALFIALKIEIQENGDLVAISPHVPSSIIQALIHAFLNPLSKDKK